MQLMSVGDTQTHPPELVREVVHQLDPQIRHFRDHDHPLGQFAARAGCNEAQGQHRRSHNGGDGGPTAAVLVVWLARHSVLPGAPHKLRPSH